MTNRPHRSSQPPLTSPEADEPAAATPQLAPLLDLARSRRAIVAFTGAGISTDSGIPDYRGPNGVWKTQTPLTVQAFLRDPDVRRGYWERRRTGYTVMADAAPNSGHLALAALERAGRLHALITQNIDGLHQKAGNDPDRVIELHGTTHQIVCTNCGRRYTGAEVQAWLQANEDVPTCPVCGGMLRPATVLFGEALSPPVWERAVAVTREADLLLVVGSSLVVNPAASLPLLAKEHGAAVAIVNRDPTPLDNLADVVIHGGVGDVFPALAERLAAPGDASEAGAG